MTLTLKRAYEIAKKLSDKEFLIKAKFKNDDWDCFYEAGTIYLKNYDNFLDIFTARQRELAMRLYDLMEDYGPYFDVDFESDNYIPMRHIESGVIARGVFKRRCFKSHFDAALALDYESFSRILIENNINTLALTEDDDDRILTLSREFVNCSISYSSKLSFARMYDHEKEFNVVKIENEDALRNYERDDRFFGACEFGQKYGMDI